MINGHATHNSFTSVASALTVFEERDGVPISIGVSDATISDTGINDDGVTVPVPTMTIWGLLLLLISIIGVSYIGLRRISRS